MRLHAGTFNCRPFSDRPFSKMIESYDEEFREVNEALTQKLNDLMVGKEIHEVVTTCLDIYTKTQSIILSDRFKSLTEEEKDQIK